MRQGNFSKEALNSQAYLSKIRIFIPRGVSYPSENKATFYPYRSRNHYSFSGEIKAGITRNFPIIFRGNGEPWDIGNLYLMHKMSEMAMFEEVIVATLETHATHLLAFLRWLEHNQSNGNAINEFTFPDDPHDRVTYAYRRYLMRQVRKVPPPISLKVAKTRIGIVTAFYRSLIDGNLVGESKVKNSPYRSKVAGIPYLSPEGLLRIREVLTTDLAIRVPGRNDAQDGFLRDGGKLRPLTYKEQEHIYAALQGYGNRAFTLMMLTALTTGARKQTVCTLRIGPIRNLLKKTKDEMLKLKVGIGTEVDVKSKGDTKSYRLHIPRAVAKSIIDYADSPEAKLKRERSFYGDSDRNYVFLTSSGTPYYTSKAELRDRDDPEFSTRLSARDRVDFVPSKGRALNNLVSRLIKKIRENHPDFRQFRFHDTRATYGMNFVRHFVGSGMPPNVVVEQLRIRMAHANLETTFQYLNFDEEYEQAQTVEDNYYGYLSIRINRVELFCPT